ncbi:MAG: DUF3883 domain-containing protein, partial [Acidobacteria bacterium]|nr:DUF3883 domain-containing protein [Acidobacteriota bacterium]
KIKYSGNFLLVGNDGRIFDKTDFESLCRSAHSLKARGVSIGYRGIGFKSVLSIASKICLFSGELEATFCRQRTALEVPETTRVPLVRIPHPMLPEEREALRDGVSAFTNSGVETVFAFENLKPNAVQIELDGFDPTSLLFLRHISEVEIQRAETVSIKVQRSDIDGQTRLIRLRVQGRESLWKIIEQDGVSIAFSVGSDGVLGLDESEALVYAFLPTLETTGFPIKTNGDISTDPSRTRVVLDERTADCIDRFARLVVGLVERGARDGAKPEDVQLLTALVPLSDPRMATFQRRSFRSEFLAAIRRISEGKFAKLYCRPPWLNAVDFDAVAKDSRIHPVRRELENIGGLIEFLKFLGAHEATLSDLSIGLKSTPPSLVGAAEVVAHVTNRHATKQLDTCAIDQGWKIWPVGGVAKPLNEATQAKSTLASDFVDLVAEKTGGGGQLKRLLDSLTNPATAVKLLPPEPQPATNVAGGHSPISGNAPQQLPNRILSLKRWRSAEQQVLELLQAGGCNVKDVSRQNVGYDIEGTEPAGKEICVEVKLIDYPGQPFTLTSNEEAVARLKGVAYMIALVRQTDTHLEVAFIRDPVTQIRLVRQCKQWVWECNDYTFSPERYAFEQ